MDHKYLKKGSAKDIVPLIKAAGFSYLPAGKRGGYVFDTTVGADRFTRGEEVVPVAVLDKKGIRAYDPHGEYSPSSREARTRLVDVLSRAEA